MEIFLGAETEGPAAGKWFILQKEFSRSLLKIRDNNYGIHLSNIGIISIIMRDEYFEEGGYKERIYYCKKRREADIRLRLNYNKFLKANDLVRKEMYISHILASIQIAGEKAGNDFNLNQLLSDVKKLLEGKQTEDGSLS